MIDILLPCKYAGELTSILLKPLTSQPLLIGHGFRGVVSSWSLKRSFCHTDRTGTVCPQYGSFDVGLNSIPTKDVSES